MSKQQCTTHCTKGDDESGYPRKYVCPENGNEYSAVPKYTILHHIKAPWRRYLKQQGYYFCDDPDCAVVYFGEDDLVINKDELRTHVGQKDESTESPLCYCFGISYQDVNLAAMMGEFSHIKNFVIEQTRQSDCGCDVRNPSGKCCLRDFPNYRDDY